MPLFNLLQQLFRTFEDEVRHVEDVERQFPGQRLGNLEAAILHAAAHGDFVLRRSAS
jgi:hypothetical protein